MKPGKVLATPQLWLICLPGMLLAQASTAAQPLQSPRQVALAATEGAGIEAELMRQSQSWVALGRTDLARQSLEKLLAFNPRAPQAMAALGSLALEEGKPQQAQQLLEDLRYQFPAHRATADLGALVRVYGSEQEKLARMRLLARAGRTDEAAQLARELFPAGAPGVGTLGAEYNRLIPPGAQLPAPAESAAVASSRPLESGEPRAAVSRAAPTPVPPDPARLMLAAAEKAMEADDLAEAQRQLQAGLARNPKDADILGTLGLVRLRQGQHSQARELFEQAYGLSGTQKWQDLLATARFWGGLAFAEEAGAQGQWDRAAQAVQEALQLQPDHPRALNALAGIRAQQGQIEAAQALYEKVLQKEPDNATALRASIELLQRQGRSQEALAKLDALQQGNPAAAQTLASLRADMLRHQVQAALQAGHVADALPLLQSSITLEPADPWLRHRLARLQIQLGRKADALQTMDEGVKLRPDEAEMRYARALIRSASDDPAGARDDLESISPEQRSDGMRQLLHRSVVHSAINAAAVPGADVAAALGRAEQQAQDDPDLLSSVANMWLRQGAPDEAVAVFDRLAQRQRPLPADAALERAALLARARKDDRLGNLLGPLLEKTGWSNEQAQRLLEIQTEHLVRRIEMAVTAGDATRVQRLSSAPLLAHAGLPPARLAWARGSLLLAAQDWRGAARQLQQALPAMPQDSDVRMGLAQALVRSGQPEQAREHARWLSQQLPADDRGQQLALLRLWQRIPDDQAARSLAEQLLKRYPGDTGVLLHAARMEQSQDRYGEALAHYRQAEATQPSDAEDRQSIAQNIQSIEARRQSWVEVGAVHLGKSATDGVSSLRGWELPAVAWIPRGYDGHHFLHVDQVRLNAGGLPGSAADATSYGQVAAWPAAAYPAQPGTPHANGVNLGVGYRGRGLEWDIGLIGIGFPVTNLVGGLSYGQWSEDFSWRAELSRRPITGSLLSYAGVRDPITGQTWGGVTATGLSGRISRPWAGNSVSLSGSYALLQGRNVRDNTRLQLRAAIDRDVWRSERSSVNVGAALSLWRYGRDLSEYTWGHGGYYSPQRYASLSLPLEWGGRQGAWSWQLRGALSRSHSSSQPTEFYPGQPQLQAQAQALGFDPFYGGGGSTGFGRSLRATIEYQFAPSGVVGALLSMDRSAYYAPTQLMMYLRLLLEPVRVMPPDRPRPLQPYSDF